MLTADRVRIPRLEVEIDMSQQEISTHEVLPTVIREDNPLTPYDDSQLELYVPLSIESTEEQFRGTGFNPEGPPGQEGQTPPAYQDLQDRSASGAIPFAARTTRSPRARLRK